MSFGNGAVKFLIGFGIGFAVGILFAPQSGEENRQWLTETAHNTTRQIRRKGRRVIFETIDAFDRGEEVVSRVLRTSKRALDTIAAKLA